MQITQRLAVWAVFLLVGFIGGMYFQDHFGAPKTKQEVTIGKQKVKGQSNQTDFKTEVQQENHNGKEKRKGGIFRIFRRRRSDESDSVDVGYYGGNN